MIKLKKISLSVAFSSFTGFYIRKGSFSILLQNGVIIIVTNKEIEDVMSKYSDMVYRIAYIRTLNYSDAQDIYQEVFLRYARKAPVFNNEEHCKAWLIRVTVNCSNKVTKQRGRVIPAENAEPKEDVFNVQRNIELLEAISELPQNYREVIHLFYFEDLSTDKIAKLLHRRRSTVTVQLSRARGLLKKILSED